MNINNEVQANFVLIQITDLHIFTNEAYEFNGVNPALTLRLVIEQIRQEFPTFDHMFVTGDLVQEPERAAYKLVSKLLNEFDQNINYLPGNHDDPKLMGDVFDGNVRLQINLGNWVVFSLNTCKSKAQSGYLTKEDLTELDKGLKACQDKNVLVLLHHQPILIGSEWMDSMMLENADEFFAVIDQYDHIKSVAWGHNHQEFFQIRNGVELYATPSTCVQYTPKAKDFEVDVENMPGYRWFKLSDDGSIETGVNRLDQEVTLSLK
ncbi:MAG: phosphodiesterase [Gammaproteobacteria bacterium]